MSVHVYTPLESERRHPFKARVARGEEAELAMAPQFLRNLVPRRDNSVNKRSFFAALKTITPLQYAHFVLG